MREEQSEKYAKSNSKPHTIETKSSATARTTRSSFFLCLVLSLTFAYITLYDGSGNGANWHSYTEICFTKLHSLQTIWYGATSQASHKPLCVWHSFVRCATLSVVPPQMYCSRSKPYDNTSLFAFSLLLLFFFIVLFVGQMRRSMGCRRYVSRTYAVRINTYRYTTLYFIK